MATTSTAPEATAATVKFVSTKPGKRFPKDGETEVPTAEPVPEMTLTVTPAHARFSEFFNQHIEDVKENPDTSSVPKQLDLVAAWTLPLIQEYLEVHKDDDEVPEVQPNEKCHEAQKLSDVHDELDIDLMEKY
eukprot:Selendium_serpulae@DN10223_c0_g1_i1.p1